MNAVVEETLRYESPVQWFIRRTTTEHAPSPAPAPISVRPRRTVITITAITALALAAAVSVFVTTREPAGQSPTPDSGKLTDPVSHSPDPAAPGSSVSSDTKQPDTGPPRVPDAGQSDRAGQARVPDKRPTGHKKQVTTKTTTNAEPAAGAGSSSGSGSAQQPVLGPDDLL